MQEVINLIQPYLIYLVPPLVGAFIGYLTNRIAIRMLFRPLKAWRIMGVRIPMTPGVIPSKRRELAVNMGQMVGEHLLTSHEVGKALKKDAFQDHLLSLIEKKVGAILERDLGPLPSLVPAKFTTYFDVGLTTIKYQIKENVTSFIHSENFERAVSNEVEKGIDEFLKHDFNQIINKNERLETYDFLQEKIKQVLTSDSMNLWVETYLKTKIYKILQQGKTLSDLAPETSTELLIKVGQEQVPVFLEKLGQITSEPLIRDKIVESVKKGVEQFIASLGPMSAMVSNFLTMEMVDEKVREYLDENQELIQKGIQGEDIKERINKVFNERIQYFFNIPLVDLLPENSENNVEEFCAQLSTSIVALLREEKTAASLSTLIQTNFEEYAETNPAMGQVLEEFLGKDKIDLAKKWLIGEIIKFFRTQNSLKTVENMLYGLIDKLMQKPIGQLSKLLPAGVRDGMYISLRNLSAQMLESEVPGLVHSLNIQNIVTEKIDSLDLLKLEALLLSIMEEQFKYINLFGALLGFIIGCFNLIIIYWI